MRIVKFTKKTFFTLTVKSPITVLVIIGLIIYSLLYISFTNYSSVYVKIKGTLQRSASSFDSPYVKVMLNKKYVGNINTQTPVIWYCSNNGKRYEGSINAIDINGDNDSLAVRINLSKADVAIEKPEEVTLELLVKKVKIIEKLTMEKEED